MNISTFWFSVYFLVVHRVVAMSNTFCIKQSHSLKLENEKKTWILYFSGDLLFVYWPVGWAVTRLSLEREVWDSNLRPVKSDTVLPMARHRCDICSKRAVLPSGALTRKWAPQTRYTLWRNAASIMQDFDLIIVYFSYIQTAILQVHFLSRCLYIAELCQRSAKSSGLSSVIAPL